MNIDSNVFIAPGAQIIGDVNIKSGSSIWYNAVLRGDEGAICSGSNTNIQDLVMVHVSKNTSTVIGDNVTVGHGAIIHGCTIEDNVLIGMGSIILVRAQIGKNHILSRSSSYRICFFICSKYDTFLKDCITYVIFYQPQT